MKMKHRIESYKHNLAKEVLKLWFEKNYTCETEKKFYIDGRIAFIPDLVLMDNGIIVAVYEVVHKHGLNGMKLGLIQFWCYLHYDFPVYEISADYIMNQIECPAIVGTYVLGCDRFETINLFAEV